MGRPSKLSDRQKAEIGRRLASGEKAAFLADEFKISRSRFHALFSGQVTEIQKLATALASTELEIDALPISGQVSVRTLADQLKGMQSDFMAGASKGLRTANKLQAIAERRVDSLHPDTVETEDLRLVAALTDTANKAAQMGTNLLNANKCQTQNETRIVTPEEADAIVRAAR